MQYTSDMSRQASMRGMQFSDTNMQEIFDTPPTIPEMFCEDASSHPFHPFTFDHHGMNMMTQCVGIPPSAEDLVSSANFHYSLPKDYSTSGTVIPAEGLFGCHDVQDALGGVQMHHELVMQIPANVAHGDDYVSDSSLKRLIPRQNKPRRLKKTDKKQCPDCNASFRGEHELKRHQNLKHTDERVVFVAANKNNRPEIKLESCSKCRIGKAYGAEHNLAAHLRRTHFNPPIGRRRRGGKSERRGGIGGGHWPGLDYLREHFIERKTVAGALELADAEADTRASMSPDPVPSTPPINVPNPLRTRPCQNPYPIHVAINGGAQVPRRTYLPTNNQIVWAPEPSLERFGHDVSGQLLEISDNSHTYAAVSQITETERFPYFFSRFDEPGDIKYMLSDE